MDSKLWILLNPASDQVHKHSETALDTPPKKNEGTESSFPIKVHAIPGKTPAICEFLVVQMWCNRGAKGKRKMQVFKNQALAFCMVPCELPVFEPIHGRFGWDLSVEEVFPVV